MDSGNEGFSAPDGGPPSTSQAEVGAFQQQPAAVPADSQSMPAPPVVRTAAPTAGWPGLICVNGAYWAPAGFSPRLAAFLIDMLLLYILHGLLVWIAGVHAPSYEETMRVSQRMLEELSRGAMFGRQTLDDLLRLQRPVLLAGWLNVLMCGAYFTIFHGLLGASLGKLALGLRVLRRDGRPLGCGLALLRYLLYFVLAKLAYTAWLIPFEAQRRTLYDMLLGTNVFKPLKRS